MQHAQVACDSCHAELRADLAYCDRCGARTRRARRLVNIAIRVEVLLFLLMAGLVATFIAVYTLQK